jgi:PIN domain nuclease of toxin-antitoxin system
LIFLLDTHVWIWLLETPDRLPDRCGKILMGPDPFIGISSISLWEIAKKSSKGKLTFSIPINQWLTQATSDVGIKIFELTPEIAYESCYLPGAFHKDPADQIIVATARVNDLVLITKDQKILNYEHVKTLWE